MFDETSPIIYDRDMEHRYKCAVEHTVDYALHAMHSKHKHIKHDRQLICSVTRPCTNTNECNTVAVVVTH
jgi:hypothetical protein